MLFAFYERKSPPADDFWCPPQVVPDDDEGSWSRRNPSIGASPSRRRVDFVRRAPPDQPSGPS
jgi:hypothetical protein